MVEAHRFGRFKKIGQNLERIGGNMTVSEQSRQGKQVSWAMFYMCLAVWLFSSMDAEIKYLSAHFSNMQLLSSRAFLALIPALIMIWVYCRRHQNSLMAQLKPQSWRAHGAIHISNVLSLWAFYQAFGEMALADAYAVFFTAPLCVTLLSRIFLKEQIGKHRWGAVCIGFVGILIMVRPGSDLFSQAALICGIGTFLYAVSIVSTRLASETETPLSLMMTSILTIALVALIGCLVNWETPLGPLAPDWQNKSVDPDWMVILIFMGVGLCGGFGQWASFVAFQRAEASLLTPFEFSAMLWGVLYGFLIWQDLPTIEVVMGGSLIILAGLYTVHREHKRAVQTEKILPPLP